MTSLNVVLLVVMILTDVGGAWFTWHLIREAHRERAEMEDRFAVERCGLLDRIQAPEQAAFQAFPVSDVAENTVGIDDDEAFHQYVTAREV